MMALAKGRGLFRRVDWFLTGMLVAVALAWLFPGPGSDGGFLHPEILTKAGVALVFFLHGLGLPFASLRAGTLRWPVHLLIQTCTFLFFPVLGLGMLAIFGSGTPAGLRLGFFFLCALPGTVSSAVAMTATAGGNVSLAVFNATLSALIGVVVTPVWIAWYTGSTGEGLPLFDVILDLVKWLVLPLAVGQILRRWAAGWAHRNKRYTNLVDRGTILMLVYTSFCDSVTRGVWTGHGGQAIVWATALSAILLTIALLTTSRSCRILRFDEPERIAVIFCGSKKTLASGVPMASLIFGSTPELGLILLPIMIYHPMQLIVCGILAGRWGRRRSRAGTHVREHAHS